MNGDARKWDRRDFRNSKKQKFIRSAEEELEAKLGFDIFSEGDKRLGWLLTFASSSSEDQDTRKVYSCVDLYFVSQDGSTFKTKYKFRPYFYAGTKDQMEMDVEAYLRRRYESQIADIEIVEKEDLDLKNHLSGLCKSYLKLSFDTVQQLMSVKRDLLHVVERNQAKSDATEAYELILTGKREKRSQDFLDYIVDLREYDVPYHVRFAIDNDIRCGQWYDVSISSNDVMLERRTDLLQRAEVRVCAFDIETTKLPLKFPDAEYDLVMMISYMVDGQGYLIINRECVGDDIEDLEYTPKPEFEGHFKVTNVKNELELLKLWFSHMREVKPGIYVTYNGDFFDWPFLEKRAAHHGFKLSDEVGFQCDYNQGECRAKFACHLDCFAWVKRDSYLPQGSQGLKAVTKAKLGYDPLEVNPEDMVRYAMEKPQMMASYSVSDAVSTYYLYMTYVHPFIFSLATIIPMSPDEVLRKGSGTLCEMLLMVQAYKANVICPNKHQSESEKFHNNRLLESETYIGGHVECLESGVFRSDLLTSFKLDPSGYQQLIDNLDRDLQYAIRVEGKMDLDSVSNYDEVRSSIFEKAELFDKFLNGSTLVECYSAVASVANRWLDLLDNQGKDIADSELLDYISESSTMSKSLADYGGQKSCAVTTAKRLADFLGDAMVKDKGLRCQYIVACEPKGTPVSERAVPVAIFETDAEIMKFYVRKWCKISSDVGIRSIIDWSYYKQRLSSSIQKIVTIPAAMQKVANPVPRVVHPDWLHKKVREKDDKFRQQKLADVFSSFKKDELLKRKDETVGISNVIEEEVVGDLEDFQKNKSSVKGPRPVVRCYEVNNKNNSVENVAQECPHQADNNEKEQQVQDSSISEIIDRTVDYQGWLEIKKRKWKDSLNKRKRQKLGNATRHNASGLPQLPSQASNKEAQGGTGVSSYFKRHEVAITRCHWQIVQLVPDSQLGQFFAWIVVEGVMLKIPVTVPRVFYINSKAPLEDKFPGRRSNKILPHGKHNYNLYEVVIDEGQFKAESKNLTALLADPEVEGIYETKVPLDLNAIVQIGCVCKVDKAAKKRNIQDSWSLSELHTKTTTECSYLEQSISFFYLYHSISEGRAIFVVYFPSRTMSVVVVNPYQNKDLSPSFLEKQFRDACQALSVQPPPPSNEFMFKVEYVGSVKDAEKILQRTLNQQRREHHGPTIAVIECPNAQSMKSGIRALDDFPCVSIPSNARDSHYQVLGWQQVAAKIGMQRCAASSQWLNERISLSRYAHVPLGNFELDWLIHTADVIFSRALRDQQQVLWISDDGIPDLGGINEEDTCFVDEVHQPVLTYPGAYRKVTVELKIHHLAVDALLKSNQINEMEGGALLGFEADVNSGAHNSNEQSGFDEGTSCASAFRVLKQLIQRCLTDAVTSGNVFADAILQHLYRWLCSPHSKLHDPALHRLLHKVMKKVFALLLAEFRKLGASIVFANFTKIIIDTGKSDLSAAKAYCDSLLKTLQTRDLFEWIELEQLQFWHSLLFMDQYNYGGIPARADESVHEESEVDIVSSWNIAEDLPKKIQDNFIFIVSQFLYIPWNYAKKQAAIRASLQDGSSSTPSITISAAENFESHLTEHLKGQISTYFTEKLLGIVRDIILHMKELSKSEKEASASAGMPQLSTNANRGDAALEFIKHVCAVLALDQSVQHNVLVMRKNLLKYVRVREFAPEAQFCDPFSSFILPNVICSYCNDCRDLDLCRDSALLAQEWRCAVPQCGQPYNREVMENSLIQIVRQRERLYHVQDLVCQRCRQVKAAHLAEQCGCAGSYRCKEDVSEFNRKMQIFLNIAIRQKFQLLEEFTSWILGIHSVQD
ncbi:DNA polymerase epsilon catalytic subunit A-like isoform X2 [Humulus lupulus]|uniref:DNA polymerase epsilon catalytic subunit A-like isoform X2 n=1 Tax=Humulus lupulus TaxID=3486 RepID=UPI002B414DA6|nr:DNA polymerase epsilon catalytic subunit A-like isoform X2 [Humulus lupulus]